MAVDAGVGDLEQHSPRHVVDDLVVEIAAGGCLGDSYEGYYCPEIPGPLAGWSSTWAEFEGWVMNARRAPGGPAG